ncbi:MAG TPA: glycosyltransferase [Candidatus Limiplasma sp.]|nr:glycosyltransferase [Candidatus Limiplasma sp.]HPS81493.1 glycosyltransferase [Candidatus Limiplasma sp.]
MLIGQFCETYPPTLDGVGRVMLSYCQSLNALGHQALYIAPNNPLYPERVDCETLLYDGIRVPGEPYRVGIPRLSKSYRNATSHMRFDVVHAHSPFFGGREARRLARRDGAPLVATFHSKYYDDFYKATGSKMLAEMGVRFVVDFFDTCDEVWAVNDKTAEVLKSYGYRGEIVTMPNGTNRLNLSEQDRRHAEQRFPLRQGVPTLIFAGQQNKKKNTESVLRACALLKNRNFDFQLIMIGDGPDAHFLHTLAHDLDIDGRVLFTGFLSHRPTVMALYERADLMVFPSIYDNAPMVVREAAAMGTPALLVEGSCAAEGVTHGENGYLCRNTVESIADGIQAALPTARSVGQRARDTIPIPWDTLMLQVVARYEALIARKARD